MKRRSLLKTSVAALLLSGASLSLSSPALAEGYGDTHELVMGLPYTMTTLDPAVGGSLRTDLSIVASVYSSLTRVSAEGEVVGVAATGWEQTSDTTWTFDLRDDVVFSDGTPLTADIIKWNIDRINAIETPSWIVISMKNIAETKVVGEHKIEFTLTQPDLNFPRRLAGVFFLEPKWTETHNPAMEAMGSGAYKLLSYNPETGAELEANPTFYGEPAAFKKVKFRVMSDEASRINALKAGELDTAALINPQDLQQLDDAGGVVTGIIPSTRVQIIRFNTLVKPLDDVRVREAINYAIDKDAITKALFRGLVQPAHSQIITPLHEGYNTDLQAWPYDPAKAKELLAEAGYPDGFEVEMGFGKGTYVGGEQAAQIVVAMLAQVGITAKLSIVPTSVYWGRANTDEQAGLSWFGYADTSTIAADTMSYIANGFVQTRGPLPNGLNEALDEAKAAGTKEEELAALKKATQAAADDALVAFLWDLPQTFAYSDKVVWKVRSDDWQLPYDVTPAE